MDHLVKLRELQDQTSGFLCFIPLAFHPQGTDLARLPGPSAIDSLKTIAVSRLMLDNVPHIKAYWVLLGKNIAQVALRFGADDVDGTISRGGSLMESYLAEGNDNQLTRGEIEELIRGAGRVPVERDTLYNAIEAAPGAAQLPERRASLPVVGSSSKADAPSPVRS